ncbi:putative protein N(5)-glutamine methyltransferase [Xylanimonas oleitrophica]|uniref:putative protein N(5)-glutamine methyltransferase n=1 Tax=Xylanimonas oleitrophica TaxID=2607479 RepID=UPI001FE81F2D
MARLRAAGCVFPEEEARLLLEAAGLDVPPGRTSPDRQLELPIPQGAAERDAGTAPPGRAASLEALDALVTRREAGEPLEHLLGWVELAGRRWHVGPGVFVPRQRSELMVAQALDLVAAGPWCRTAGPTLTVLDLCCGSGAVGGAVVARLLARAARRSRTGDGSGDGSGSGDGGKHHPEPAVVLHAADVDPAATAYAARNLEPLGGTVHTGDLYSALPVTLRGTVDLLLCHAPYVPTAALATMPPEARDHEPRTALDGGPDGLDVLRRVVAGAPRWLAPGGSLLFEVGDEHQLTETTALLGRAGLTPAVVQDDEAGATVVVGTARTSAAA